MNGRCINGKTWAWNVDRFRNTVPLTPDSYNSSREQDLNEWRDRAGLPVKTIYKTRRDIQELKAAAGI